MTQNHARRAAAALVASLITACGDGATPASRTVGGTFLSERDLHEGAVPELSHPVVLRLEGDRSRVHSGDLGDAGEDVFQVRVDAARRLDLHLGADGRRHLSASLVAANGTVLATLDADDPSDTVDLDPGQYQVRIARTSSGGDLLVFFRDGRLSRNCERCDLSALQGGRADIAGASFRGSNLRNAVLAATNCSGTDFTGADLEEAMLSGADCRNATFDGANLFGASLLGADMSGTDLTAEQRASLNAIASANDALEAAAQFSFTPQNLTVRAGAPYIIDSEDGGATALNFGTVTIQDGGQIQIATSAHISIQNLVAESQSSATNFLLAGKDGSPGDAGANGTPTGQCAFPDEPRPRDGQVGDPGTDGDDAPFVAINVASVTGTVVMEVRGGDGGAGGAGGDGAAGGNGGDGGAGGAAGLGSEVTLFYQQLSSGGDFQTGSESAAGGAGGPGGAAGASIDDLPPCVPESGAPGASGIPGGASEIKVLQQ